VSYIFNPASLSGTTVAAPPQWDPAKMGPHIALSNNNQVATHDLVANTPSSVLSVTGHASGKWYAEAVITATSATGNDAIGVAYGNANLNSYLGIDANSWGYFLQSSALFHNNANSPFSVTTPHVGDIIQIAWDGDTGNLFFGLNGVWQNAGNPVTETNPCYIGVLGTLYLAGSVDSNGIVAGQVSIRPNVYAPPTGYNSWGATVTAPSVVGKPFIDNGYTVGWYGPAVFPNAFYVASTNTTWIAWLGPGASLQQPGFWIKTYNHATKTWTPGGFVGLSPINNDDHGNPAIVRDAQGYVHMFAGCHSTICKHFVTVNPDDPTAWIDRNDGINDGVTYPHPFLIGNTIYLFFRGGTGTGPLANLAFYKSTPVNGATTWTPVVNITDEGAGGRDDLGQFDVKGTDIYICITQNNVPNTWSQNVYVLVYHTANGSVSNLAGTHTVVPASFPIVLADLNTYFIAQRFYNFDFNVPSLAFDTAGTLHLIWNNQFQVGSDPAYWDQVYYSRWTGTQWTPPHAIAASHDQLGGSSGFYSGGPLVVPLATGGLRFITGTALDILTTTRINGGATALATFDPMHVNTGTVLSNGNLTVSKPSGALQSDGSTSTVGVWAGQFYCELTINQANIGDDYGIGVGNIRGAILDNSGSTNYLGSNVDGIGLFPSGSVFYNNVVLTTIAGFANGNVVSIALDATNRLVWWRTNGGNWNNNPAANPATGAGGISISGILPSFYVWVEIERSPGQVTANFGATAYAFTPPAGFGNFVSDTGIWSPILMLQEQSSEEPYLGSPARVWKGLPELEILWSDFAPFNNPGIARGWAWGESGYISGVLSGNVPTASPPRIALTGNTTFYVRTDGSDANTGLVDNFFQGWATFQHAINVIISQYDFAGFTVTITAGNEAGTKTFAGFTLAGSWTGGGALVISGNGGNTILNANPGRGDAITLVGVLPGTLTIQNIQLTSAGQNGIYHAGLGLVLLRGALTFLACTGAHVFAFGTNANMDIDASYTIAGGAYAHIQSFYGALVADNVIGTTAVTVTLSGTPVFTQDFFFAAGTGIIRLVQTTYSGTGTGQKWRLSEGGLIETPGDFQTFVPTSGNYAYSSGIYRDGSHGSNTFVGDDSAGVAAVGGSWAVNRAFDTIVWGGSPAANMGWAAGPVATMLNTFETGWTRDAIYSIGQRNGANAQRYSLYNTWTSLTNFERAILDWITTANLFRFGTSKGSGGGIARDLSIITGDTEAIRVNATTQTVLASNPTGGLGYGPAGGAVGGTVTQATDKSTGVTLSKVTGQITMNAAALAASTTVSFVLTNTVIAATDLLVLNHVSGGTLGSYTLNSQPAAGSATINVRNVSLASLSEAIVIGFAVVKAVTT
jgi:hypothetical protein